MPKVRFNLRNKTKPTTLILLIFRYNNSRFVYSSQLKIPPKDWNLKTQRIKSSFDLWKSYNSILDLLEKTTTLEYNKGIDNRKLVTHGELKLVLDKCLLKDQKINSIEFNLLDFFEKFIEERRENPKYVLGTIKKYVSTRNKIKEYCKTKRIKKLYFEDINMDFFYEFTDWMYDKKYSINYVDSVIRILKSVMNDAVDRGLTTSVKFRNKRFSITTHESENIYLNLKELKLLYDLELNAKLSKARDWFLIGCYTGLRFSDWHSVCPENVINVQGKEVLHIKMRKTKNNVIIPLHPVVKSIFEKYDNQLPKLPSMQKVNDYIKEVGLKAGLVETVFVTNSQGGKIRQDTKMKYQRICTHTARRSFATNAFKAGMPAISIMKITGHRTEAAFLKYIKISLEENAVLMADNPFFQKQ